MKVLLSIKPEYAELILSGKKKFEFRKGIFKRPVKTVVIYATLPVGKIIGEFDIDEVIFRDTETLWQETKKHAGISKVFFDSYFNNRNKGFAIKVKNPKRYENPMTFKDFLPNSIPPQSYRYI
ncbi:ASCH domain-containing protein [Orbus wheelerorum]|uniref:ASCH domain-containing protein n=1 Tax=Orbus wheelerorum TaxID=3074111 RepID=UPI00370D9138